MTAFECSSIGPHEHCRNSPLNFGDRILKHNRICPTFSNSRSFLLFVAVLSSFNYFQLRNCFLVVLLCGLNAVSEELSIRGYPSLPICNLCLHFLDLHHCGPQISSAHPPQLAQPANSPLIQSELQDSRHGGTRRKEDHVKIRELLFILPRYCTHG